MSSSKNPPAPGERALQTSGPGMPGLVTGEADDPIDETGVESFPASDPPAWIFREPRRGGTAASGAHEEDGNRAVPVSMGLHQLILPMEGQMTLFKSPAALLSDAKNAMLADNWWIVALRGMLAILFGIGAFVLPGATMLALVTLFAAFAILDGAFGIAQAVRGARRRERWGLLLLNGVLGIAIGVATVAWPDITVLAFVLVIGAWAFVSGGLMLGTAFGLKTSHGRLLLVFGAVVSILYGGLLFVSPFIGALVLTWWVGAHALILGVTLIGLAFKLRNHRTSTQQPKLTLADDGDPRAGQA